MLQLFFAHLFEMGNQSADGLLVHMNPAAAHARLYTPAQSRLQKMGGSVIAHTQACAPCSPGLYRRRIFLQCPFLHCAGMDNDLLAFWDCSPLNSAGRRRSPLYSPPARPVRHTTPVASSTTLACSPAETCSTSLPSLMIFKILLPARSCSHSRGISSPLACFLSASSSCLKTSPCMALPYSNASSALPLPGRMPG